jgi:replicative DNA helicase
MILNKEELKEKFEAQYKRGQEGLNVGLPMPFTLLSEEVCGIQQGRYDLWAGATGDGKSTITQECYISYPIQYCEKNKSTVPYKYHCEYFNLEIKDINVVAKLLANWIFKESAGTIKLSVNKIFQKGSNKITTEEKDWIKKSYSYYDFLGEHVNFIAGDNISEAYIYKRLMECARAFGTMKKENGKDLLYTYKPKDPNQYVVFIFDNVNNLNDKRLIDSVSSMFVKFRNACDFSFVVVQQYNRDQQNSNREFMEPQLADLKETGQPGQDSDVAFLSYNPKRLGQDAYEGYNLLEGYKGSKKALGDFLRFLKIAKNRDGKDGIYLPFALNGAMGIVKEMPAPNNWNNNLNNIKDYYYKYF